MVVKSWWHRTQYLLESHKHHQDSNETRHQNNFRNISQANIKKWFWADKAWHSGNKMAPKEQNLRSITFIPLYRARDLQERRHEWSYSDLTYSWSRCIFFLRRHCFQDQAQGYASTDSILCTDPSHQSYAATELISSMNLLKASSYLQLNEVCLLWIRF